MGNGRNKAEDCSMFCHRTVSEADHLFPLDKLSQSLIEEWSDRALVIRQAWVWNRAQLWMEFRYKRKNAVYWQRYVKNERQLWELINIKTKEIFSAHKNNIYTFNKYAIYTLHET